MMILAVLSADTLIGTAMPIRFVIFLAFLRADAIVFLLCLVFISADTIYLTMIPVVFALVLAFSKAVAVVFAVILSFLCTDTVVFHDFYAFCSDSRILKYRYCFS